MTAAELNSRPDSAEHKSASRSAIVGWIFFDWAAQPFYTLITTFLFAPYFATVFISDPVRGQALWGYAAAAGGLIVALLSPIFGAVADASGRRKPWIAVFSVLLITGMSLLWFAVPGAEGRLIPVLAAFVMALVAAEFATVFTNSMMPNLVSEDHLGRLSGIGWAAGYLGGLVSLALMAGLFIVDPESGRTLLGFEPIVTLDQDAREGDRLVGPFSALWYLIFVLPLFLFTPDAPAVKIGVGEAIQKGLNQLKSTVLELRHYRDILVFLVARMLYADGLAAIFVFGGIYAASVFGWSVFALGLFGLILTVAGAIGAFAGGFLDDWIGSKPLILVSLAGLLAAAIGILSVDANHIFFVTEVPAKAAASAPFTSVGEKVYLGFAILIGLVAGPLQASSRTLLARLAPKDKITEFFGLFAFSGKVTSFMAPLLVGAVTAATGNQRLGIGAITIFLIAGAGLMVTVRAPNRKRL